MAPHLGCAVYAACNFRIKSTDGEDVIDVLIRRLQASQRFVRRAYSGRSSTAFARSAASEPRPVQAPSIVERAM